MTKDVAHPTKSPPTEDRIQPPSPWARAYVLVGGVGVACLVASFAGGASAPERLAYSYLFAFATVLAVALGALFFVLIQHLTGSNWSVTVRRVSEVMMGGLPAFVVLVIPVLLSVHQLYPWDGAAREAEPVQAGAYANALDRGDREPAALARVNSEIQNDLQAVSEAEEAHVFAGRSAYMNRPFFTFRALAYLAIWSFIAWRLLSWSTRQDTGHKLTETQNAERFAPLMTAAFAITLSLASFDWLMSLETTWYSTMFGVYVFAGCAMSGTAVLILLLRLLQRSGHLRETVTVEHYHDLGKLLFGWVSFWSYIAFAQFFLIWYANIPEEVHFFHQRWTDNMGTWKSASILLFAFHFVVPFWVLLSRNAKRNLAVLTWIAGLLVGLQILDVYWLVLPNLGVLSVSWLDGACLVGVAGVYGGAVLWAMQGRSLLCVGDPRLARALVSESP